MKYPVQAVVLPKDMKGVKNGEIPSKLLVPIDGGHLHHLAADAWYAMAVTAKAKGILLKPTSRWDLYRPYERQEALFLARYQLKKRLTKVTRQWKGKVWYLKKGVAPAGVPGTSNHGWGLAIDVAYCSGKTLRWLLKNAADFGFSWEVKEGANAEAWHIRYHCGDNIPAKVAEVLTTNPRKN